MADQKDFADQLRNLLKSQGFSNAAIDEFMKGNPITATQIPPVTPWPWVELWDERVYKDGKLHKIHPKEDEE
ncbi:MAG: hypothetical protein BMS9Abin34_218 [Patescibacteria group bacterium]|nr:MAG: hypothetical protein BMS9Abin34_218 [Patescibacteria group bacterium]